MVCKRCGFDYEGEECPVCNAEEKGTEANKTHARHSKKNAPLGIISMILGVAGLFFNHLPLAIAGLVISIKAIKTYGADDYVTTGLVTSAISIGMNVLSAVSSVMIIAASLILLG